MLRLLNEDTEISLLRCHCFHSDEPMELDDVLYNEIDFARRKCLVMVLQKTQLVLFVHTIVFGMISVKNSNLPRRREGDLLPVEFSTLHIPSPFHVLVTVSLPPHPSSLSIAISHLLWLRDEVDPASRVSTDNCDHDHKAGNVQAHAWFKVSDDCCRCGHVVCVLQVIERVHVRRAFAMETLFSSSSFPCTFFNQSRLQSTLYNPQKTNNNYYYYYNINTQQ